MESQKCKLIFFHFVFYCVLLLIGSQLVHSVQNNDSGNNITVAINNVTDNLPTMSNLNTVFEDYSVTDLSSDMAQVNVSLTNPFDIATENSKNGSTETEKLKSQQETMTSASISSYLNEEKIETERKTTGKLESQAYEKETTDPNISDGISKDKTRSMIDWTTKTVDIKEVVDRNEEDLNISKSHTMFSEITSKPWNAFTKMSSDTMKKKRYGSSTPYSSSLMPTNLKEKTNYDSRKMLFGIKFLIETDKKINIEIKNSNTLKSGNWNNMIAYTKPKETTKFPFLSRRSSLLPMFSHSILNKKNDHKKRTTNISVQPKKLAKYLRDPKSIPKKTSKDSQATRNRNTVLFSSMSSMNIYKNAKKENDSKNTKIFRYTTVKRNKSNEISYLSILIDVPVNSNISTKNQTKKVTNIHMTVKPFPFSTKFPMTSPKLTTAALPWKTQSVLSSSSTDKVCRLDKDEGWGSNMFTSWYFNRKNGRCEWFPYRGNGGNGNRFYYRANCEHACIEKYDNFCARHDIINCFEKWLHCKMESDMSCKTSGQRTCPPPQPICIDRSGIYRKPPVYLTHRSLVPPDCLLPKDTGFCKTDSRSLLMYHYSPNINDCLGFLYTSCGGNLNKFPTKQECMNRCAF